MMAASSGFCPKPGCPAIRLLSPLSIMFSVSWTGILLLRGGSIMIVVLWSNRLANDLFMVRGFGKRQVRFGDCSDFENSGLWRESRVFRCMKLSLMRRYYWIVMFALCSGLRFC